MPSYSFGNRWMGIASLTDPPVQPPLHRLALAQHEAMLHRSGSHLIILPGGESASRENTRAALAWMGRRYAIAEQWSKSDVCYELGKALQHQDLPAQAWPTWLLHQLLAITPRQRPQQGLPAIPAPPTAPRKRGLPNPPAPIDDLPVSPTVLEALNGFGWKPGKGRSRRSWLALALMHISYLHEHDALGDEVSPALLEMLATVGATWTTLAALDLQIQGDPSTTAGQQSKKSAGTRTVLPDAIASLLHAEVGGFFGRSQQPPVPKATKAVAMQICGVLVLLGDSATLGKIAAQAYFNVRASGVDIRDWRTDLEAVLAPEKPRWDVRSEGTDGAPAYAVVVTDERGNTGTGHAVSKSEAHRLAARNYMIRFHSEAATASTTAATAAEPTCLYLAPDAHIDTVSALRDLFDLPEGADPWITQALLHSSYAYENRKIVTNADQADNQLLAHHGSHVMEALRAAELARSIIARTLTPSADQARIGTSPESSLSPLFDTLGMGAGMLRGTGESHADMQRVKAGAVQALYAVAWRFKGNRLLDVGPEATTAWIEESDTSLDAFAQLDQLCRTFDIELAITETAYGPDHDRVHRATISLTYHELTASLLGPAFPAKTACRTAGASEVIKRFQAVSDAGTIGETASDKIAHLFLRAVLNNQGTTTHGLHRVVGLRLAGLSHLLAGDIEQFCKWADAAEHIAGIIDAEAFRAVTDFYTRAIAYAQAADHRVLRSRTRLAARRVAAAIAAGRPDAQRAAWVELYACQSAIGALANPDNRQLGAVIADWADASPTAAVAAAVARNSEAAAALSPKEVAMIRAVARAILGAAKENGAGAQVAFERNTAGDTLNLTLDDSDLRAMFPDLLGLAIIVTPDLTWKTIAGSVEIGLPQHTVTQQGRECRDTLAAAGRAALRAPAFSLQQFASHVDEAIRSLQVAASSKPTPTLETIGTDPIALMSAARRSGRTATSDGMAPLPDTTAHADFPQVQATTSGACDERRDSADR